MNRVSRPASEPSPPTRLGFPVLTLVGTIGLIVILTITLARSRRSDPTSPSEPSAVSEASPTIEAGNTSTRPVTSAADPTDSGAPATIRQPESRQVSAEPVSTAGEGLIDSLAQLQIANGKLTQEQGRQIQQNLRQLVSEGTAALPAIQDFLMKNLDLSFGDDGSKITGVPSLRAGLIDALRQIGGPATISLSLQVLQNTADPLEISLLSRNLEGAAPGQYRQEALDVARQALSQVAAGNLEVKDVAPLFQVLQTYGDANVAAELVKLAPQWNYYSTMALAALPDGSGIPALAELARQRPSAETGRYNALPIQMLAQLSAQYADAGSVLMAMAHQSQIPESAWRAVATGLGGSQYQFTRLLPQNTLPSGSTMEAGTSSLGGKSETFYSLPLGANGSVPDRAQRLALIDELLTTAAGRPAAIEALNEVRVKLFPAVSGNSF